MATMHTVKQGEYLSKIASNYGFASYKTIWEDPRNASLKAKRKNPNIICPGDELYIPDREDRVESGPTDKRHRYKIEREALKLRLVLQDHEKNPVAVTACRFDVGGDVTELRSDSQGLVERVIPPSAESGELKVLEQEMPLHIGYLDPIEEVSGQKARLNNLGYKCGPVVGTDERKFRSAVEEFQCDNALAVDGICGPVTQSKLKSVHGC